MKGRLQMNLDLEVKNLSFSVKGRQILHNISLDVAKGEFIGIIGPNGSGKSTLLKNVYRVLQPQNGEIILFGQNLKQVKLAQSVRQMAVVGQFHHVNFNFTVKDMVMMGRIPYQNAIGKISQTDDDIVKSALERVGMYEFKDRRFDVLSGGEQQRVILARALAQQPRFLMLDEPTNHLDIRYQLQLMEITAHLGIGVLAVLHDLNLAAMYCHRIYVLKDGRLIAQGSPHELLTPQLIKQVYHVKAEIIHSSNGRPVIAYGRGGI